jgi:hypothetical protein
MEDFERDYIKEHFAQLTPAEQREALERLAPEHRRELLQALPPEERLRVCPKGKFASPWTSSPPGIRPSRADHGGNANRAGVVPARGWVSGRWRVVATASASGLSGNLSV